MQPVKTIACVMVTQLTFPLLHSMRCVESEVAFIESCAPDALTAEPVPVDMTN